MEAWVNRRILTLRAVADVVAVAAGFGMSFLLYAWVVDSGILHRGAPGLAMYAGAGLLFAAVVMAVFWRLGLYRPHASLLNLGEMERVAQGTLYATFLFFALLFLLKLEGFSRMVIVGGIAAAALLLLAERRGLAGLVGRIRRFAAPGRRVLIYGCGSTGKLLMKKIVQAPHLGCTVVGFLDDLIPVGSVVACRISQVDPTTVERRVLGRLEQLESVVSREGVDEILVAAPALTADGLTEIVQAARSLDISVGAVPRLGDIRADQLHIEDVSAIPVLRPVRLPHHRRRAIKRALDVVGASILLIASSPAWIAAAILIRRDSPGPILFRQTRIGRDGKPFSMYKFRTMHSHVPSYAISPRADADPRITPVGRLLRRGGVDEIPQLLNVLRGEMSLVGPRPEMPFIVERYTALEMRRLEAKPGMTGIWQLSSDRGDDIHKNLEYDLFYLQRQSLLLDLLVLMETFIFSISALIRAGSRSRHTSVLPMGRPPETGFIFLALDQRRVNEPPGSWRLLLPTVEALSQGLPVKILVAEENTSRFDAILRNGGAHRNGGPGLHWEYVRYTHREQLRYVSARATLTVSDMPHLLRWAEERGIRAMPPDELLNGHLEGTGGPAPMTQPRRRADRQLSP